MTYHAHNALLDLLAETGLLAALCMVVPLALWLRSVPWSKPDLDTGWMSTLIAIQAAHSMVEYPLWHANFLGLTALLLGAAPQPLVALRFSRFREAERAGRVLSRLATVYPNTLHDHLRRLEQMARDDPAVFAALASEARRGYGR
jgi:hypothetical protein